MNIDRKIIRHNTPRDCKIQAKAIAAQPESGGTLEGYAAIWDELDLMGEIIRRGCFISGLKERIAARQVKLMSRHLAHGGGTDECVGTVTEAKEDDYGLWIAGEFSSDTHAQELRGKVVGKHVNYLSVGYMVNKYLARDPETDSEREALSKVRDRDEIVELLTCDLDEVTITPFPIQTLAVITNAKSLERIRAPIVDTKAQRGRRLSRLGVR